MSAVPASAAQLINVDPWADLRESFSPADQAADVARTEALTSDYAEPAVIEANAPTSLLEEPDWTILNSTVSAAPAALRGNQRRTIGNNASWTSERHDNGSTAMSVQQTVLPDWNARVGADLSVVNARPFVSASETLIDKYGSRTPRAEAGAGSAWLTLSTPGVASIWDKTNIEARLDPVQDVSKVRMSMTKSLPLSDPHYRIDFSNDFGVVQDGIGTLIGANGNHTMTTSQTATLSLPDTGTKFIAGQTLSTIDNKWLRRIGSEQRLSRNISLSATVSEAADGPSNKALLANFRRKW